MEGTYTIPKDPLEVLNGEPREEPLISRYWLAGCCGLLAFTGTVFTNWAIRRPMFSGIQRHVILTVAGAAFGEYVNTARNRYLADRDAVFRHYITLHPEDFPPFERKKFSEILEPWYPIR